MIAALALVVCGCMIVEALRAAVNERAQRQRGGVEAEGDVYEMMRVAYPAAFAAMIVEGLVRGASHGAAIVAGAALFASAKALKWWAIVTLGPFWTFRVIVVPGAPQISSGPYRWMRHPNYLAVVGELVGVALMTQAVITGPLSTAIFMALLSKRIAIETRMLEAARTGRARSNGTWPH